MQDLKTNGPTTPLWHVLDWWALEEEPRRELEAWALELPPAELAGTWWNAESGVDGDIDASELFAFVAGDGGAGGQWHISIYVLPIPDLEHCEELYPTITELRSIITRFTLPGTLMSTVGPGNSPSIGVSGGAPPPFNRATCIQLIQTGAEGGSPAHIRFELAKKSALSDGVLNPLRGLRA